MRNVYNKAIMKRKAIERQISLLGFWDMVSKVVEEHQGPFEQTPGFLNRINQSVSKTSLEPLYTQQRHFQSLEDHVCFTKICWSLGRCSCWVMHPRRHLVGWDSIVSSCLTLLCIFDRSIRIRSSRLGLSKVSKWYLSPIRTGRACAAPACECRNWNWWFSRISIFLFLPFYHLSQPHDILLRALLIHLSETRLLYRPLRRLQTLRRYSQLCSN